MATRSLTGRAFLALLLMILFYALAIGAVIVLVFTSVKTGGFALSMGGRAMIYLLVLAAALLVTAGVIAWSVLPRVDRFEPPGPEITHSDCPELFSEIERVGAATGQALPENVYLVPDVNAFVTERGGVMGFGSRRVMGIGLPLLELLTVAEMRGVLAHEFGHFHGGDTKLGPWLYKTRGAVGRTVINLVRTQQVAEESELGLLTLVMAAVQKPFEWFALGFMRITQAISRQQEYGADALAAGVVGSQPMISGLKNVHGGALAFGAYFNGEVSPVLSAGFRPPVADGFAQFLQGDKLKEAVESAVKEELHAGEKDPYDSHPPLKDRVAALEGIAAPTKSDDESDGARRAIELVPNVDGLEHRLFAHLADVGEDAPDEIAWSEVVVEVYEPQWRKEFARVVKKRLRNYTPASLPKDHATLESLLRKEIGDDVDYVDSESLQAWATDLMGVALTVMLLDYGFEPRAEIGEPIELVSGDEVVKPFKEVSSYLEGETGEDAWAERWQALGIGDVTIGSHDSPKSEDRSRRGR